MSVFQKIVRFNQRVLRKVLRVAEHALFRKKSRVTKTGTLLLLRLDSIGDYVLFRNFIQVLKESEKYRHYKITLCGNSWWRELAENLDKKFVDEFIWLEYSRLQDPVYRFASIRAIHRKGFDVLIHPTYSRDLLSDALVMYSGAKRKIGYNGDLVNLTAGQKAENDKNYSTLIPAQPGCVFEFYRNHFFFGQLLSEKIKLDKPHIDHVTERTNKIIICPGAKDAFRRWRPSNFAALCKQLKADFPGDEFAICGSEQDGVFAEEMMKLLPETFKNYTGKLSLYNLLTVFAEARLIITNDSGPFHLAVALSKKTVCISNGNNYGRFTPYPAEMKTQSRVLYPPELLNIQPEAERLDKFCKHGSTLDINSIGVINVYQEIKTLF